MTEQDQVALGWTYPLETDPMSLSFFIVTGSSEVIGFLNWDRSFLSVIYYDSVILFCVFVVDVIWIVR